MPVKKVFVAMSGGVDSSVAAALLKEEGYEVIGVTMCFSGTQGLSLTGSRRRPSCCSMSSIDDARRVAHKLGIKHYVLNMHKYLEEYVIKDFCSQYLLGRTPNPCIVCNQYVKFGVLLKKIFSLGGDYLATGHYARILKEKGFYWIKKSRDLRKDQSYFLYRLGQKELQSILFPVGGYNKDEVRSLAKRFSLPVAEKEDSQEICFLPQDDYREFLRRVSGDKIKPGFVTDKYGKIIGKHEGIAYYTVGQREGLGIALGYPAYIIKIEKKSNTLVLGRKEDAFAREFTVNELHFTASPVKKKIALRVKIRYNHKENIADIIPSADKISVKFRKAQFAVTPGQAAVFYLGSKIIGGGRINDVSLK